MDLILEEPLIFIMGVLLMAMAVGSFWFAGKIKRRGALKNSLSLKLLSIRLPNPIGSEDGRKSFKEEINLSEQLLSILSSNKSESTFELAVHHVGEEIQFYIAVPEKNVSFISRQIEGLFKDAQISEAAEYNIFQPNGFNIGFHLKQSNHFSLPVRTYLESDIDTFSPIVSGLSKINEIGEGAAIQVIVKPAEDRYKKSIFSIFNGLRKGESFKKIASSGLISSSELSGLFKMPREAKNDEQKPSIVDESSLKLLEKKISKPLLKVNYRILISTSNQYQSEAISDSIIGSFSQFDAPLTNGLKAIRAKDFNKLAFQFSFREFDEGQAMILNTEELAGIFHLPSSSTISPRIKWLRSKESAPPVNLPENGTKIGDADFRGERKPVYISDEDRRRHVYIIGQTGTGKTALITNMAASDIAKGKGVAIIDPHGDLPEKLLGLIPKERMKDVIYFDPGNTKKPIGLNMLEYDFSKPEQKTFIVNELLSIFDKLYDLKQTGGPMFEMYMRNALLLLMEDAPNEPATLMEIPKIFTDEDYREKKLSRISNPIVVDFWTKEAVRAGGEAALSNISPYVTSKFNNFIANDYMRPIIGQVKSSLNFRKIMDEGKILLVNLSKGRVGEINSNLLGMIIIGKLLMAAFSRIDTPENERKDFNLYIDEFQNFSTDSISVILSEARKYRLNLVIAHQFIAQLQEKIRNAVFGNVGSIISFRIGADDAQYLVKQFSPIFSENDLINIDNLNAYVKLLISGQTSKPFNIKTPLYPRPNAEIAEEIKKESFEKYGRNIFEVEEEIRGRLRS